MPIKMNCPACGKPYTLADNQAGKRVRCRNCAETFPVPGGDNDIPTVEFADNGPPLRGAVAKAPRTGAAAAVAATTLKTRSADDDRPVKAKGGSMMLPLVIGGIALFLLLLLGGGGLAVYLYVSRSVTDSADAVTSGVEKKVEQAEKDRKAGIEIKPGNNQGVVVNPGGNNPQIVFNPGQADDLRTPEDAINRLQAPNQGGLDHFPRKGAAEWLARQPVDPDKQVKVAKALERLFNVEGDGFVRGELLKALAVWATKEQLPTLIRLGEADAFANERGMAMDVIVRLKDTANVGFIIKNLSHPFAGQKAMSCLISLGKDVQGEVIKYMDHPDKGTRDKVAELLRQYNTPDDDKIRQAIADLNNAVGHPTASPVEAANYLAKVQVIPEQQQAVTRSLEGLCKSIDQNARNAGLSALAAWATPENVPTLGLALSNPGFGNFGFPMDAIINALVRLKDPRGAVGLVSLLNNGGERPKAIQALKNMGPVAEEAVLAYLLTSTDHFGKIEAIKILGVIGTRAKSLPVLARIAQDRSMQQDTLLAAQMINSRPQ